MREATELSEPSAHEVVRYEHMRTSDAPPPAPPPSKDPPPSECEAVGPATSMYNVDDGVTVRSAATTAPEPPGPPTPPSSEVPGAPEAPTATTCRLVTPAGTLNVCSVPVEVKVQLAWTPLVVQSPEAACTTPV